MDSDEGTEDKDLSTGGGGDSSGEEEEEDVEELENQSLATLLGHQDGVLTVAFHPVNEDVVATGSMDEKGLLWKVSENLCSALESLDSPDAGRPQFDLLGLRTYSQEDCFVAHRTSCTPCAILRVYLNVGSHAMGSGW